MVNRSIIILVSFAAALLIYGCAKRDGQPNQFIVCSDEEGVICSAKSTFNDTIFYENRFPDATVYYYAVLSPEQNQALKSMVQNLKTEKSIPTFELKPGGGTFIVESDEVHFYLGNYSIQSPNIKKIFTLFRDMAPKMHNCKKVEDFWNIEGVSAPDNPVE